MGFPNPPIITGPAPTAHQVPAFNATTGQWVAETPTGGTITVPQGAIADWAALTALTAATVSTANAATQSGSYVQADVQTIAALANSLKTQLNAAIADTVTLRSELTQLRTDHNTLLAELRSAGILST